MKSYTVTLQSYVPYGLPAVLDGGFHYNGSQYDPIGNGYYYLSGADGDANPYTGFFPTDSYTGAITADDQQFKPWSYHAQDVFVDIPVGPLKGPYTINFDPSGLYTPYVDILKIAYDFGDGSSVYVVNNSINALQNYNQNTQGEPLSAVTPAANIVSHDYYPQNDYQITTFTPSVTAYYSNVSRWIYNISISSAPISIYEFDDIHLISATQQLTAIETQNIFEVESPDYLTVARVVSAVDANYSTVIPFDPNTSVLSYDLITWLDASDGSTLGRDSNDRVFIWYDKSSYQNNYFCNASDGSDAPVFLTPRESQSKRKCVHFQAKPINGGPGQYLYALPIGPGPNGSAGGYVDNIFYTYGQGFTVFAVMKLNQIGSHDTLFAYDLNTNEQAYNNDPAQLALGNGQNYLPYLNISFTNNNSITIEQGDTSYYFGTSAYDSNNGIYNPTTTGTISQNLLNYSLFSTTISGNQNATAYITADTAVIQRKKQNYQNSYTTLSAFLSGGYNVATGKTIPPGQYDYNLVYGLLGTSDAYFNSFLTDAEISEFMIYDRPLNPNEIASVQAYLINKWGLTLQTN